MDISRKATASTMMGCTAWRAAVLPVRFPRPRIALLAAGRLQATASEVVDI